MNTTRQLAVGIDVQGPDAVLAVELSKDGGVRSERVLLEQVSRHIPAGARIGVNLPLRESVGRWLDTPLTSSTKARKVLPTVLDIQLPFALEECEYGFVSERKGADGKFQALAVAARHPAIAAALDAWHALGIDPRALDHEGIALWAQALVEVPLSRGAPSTARVVVYAGVDRGSIALGHGHDFVNSHTCVLEEPTRLRRLLRAAFGEALTTVDWVWCGPRIDDPAFDDTRLALEALAPGPSTTVEDPAAFLARALCARVSGGGALACNFRTGPYADVRRDEASSRALSRVSISMILVGLLLWGTTLASGLSTRRTIESAQNHFFSLYQDVAGSPPNGAQGEHAVAMAQRALDARRSRSAALLPLLAPSLTQLLFEIIATADPAMIQIHECRLSASELHLGGHAVERAAAERLEALAAEAGIDATLRWGSSAPNGHANDFVLTSQEAP